MPLLVIVEDHGAGCTGIVELADTPAPAVITVGGGDSAFAQTTHASGEIIGGGIPLATVCDGIAGSIVAEVAWTRCRQPVAGRRDGVGAGAAVQGDTGTVATGRLSGF